MAMNLIVRKGSTEALAEALGSVAESCETFGVLDEYVGISIPSKAIDQLGEAELKRRLAPVAVYDLWSGAWTCS